MPSQEIILSDKEQHFVDLLIQYEGNVRKASMEAGYGEGGYGYALRKRLAKPIAEAAQQYIAINSAKAAKKLVDVMDEAKPNATRLAAINSVLDRSGVKALVEHEEDNVKIKANIFILPEKKMFEIMDDVTDL